MSDWNSLKLQRWTPRRPSPELRRRIFGAVTELSVEAARVPRAFHFADFSQWLVPVLGCFLLVVGTLSDRYPAHQTLPGGLKNMLLSDNSAVITARADHSDKNALPTTQFEWSLRERAHSDIGSNDAFSGVLVSYTNKLIQ